jgi:hypothetical protein
MTSAIVEDQFKLSLSTIHILIHSCVYLCVSVVYRRFHFSTPYRWFITGMLWGISGSFYLSHHYFDLTASYHNYVRHPREAKFIDQHIIPRLLTMHDKAIQLYNYVFHDMDRFKLNETVKTYRAEKAIEKEK